METDSLRICIFYILESRFSASVMTTTDGFHIHSRCTVYTECLKSIAVFILFPHTLSFPFPQTISPSRAIRNTGFIRIVMEFREGRKKRKEEKKLSRRLSSQRFVLIFNGPGITSRFQFLSRVSASGLVSRISFVGRPPGIINESYRLAGAPVVLSVNFTRLI